MVAPALEQVAQEAGTYYVLAYSPTNSQDDGSFRRIEVRLKRPGLTVRARRGYLATRMSPLVRARSDAAPSVPVADPVLVANALPVDDLTRLVSPRLSPFEPIPPAPVEAASIDPTVRLTPDVRERIQQLAARANPAAIVPDPSSSPVDEIGRQARLGWERYQAGDVQGARDFLGLAAAAGSAPPWVRYVLGQAEYALSRPREAADAWELVRRAAGEFEPVYFDLVDAYIQLGDDRAALAVLREAEKRWPEDPEVFNALGVVQIRRGAIDDAIGSFRQATKVQPADATAYFNLAKAFEIRYQKRLRFSRLGQRWVADVNDLKAAAENYRRYLALDGPLESSARDALARLEWIK
ncbi:MAG: tetratricopeptide repeat protein [Acidobacteria bacterium]|nr:tetratricopeptide repeat protein [Acidobacteriota bacterium]